MSYKKDENKFVNTSRTIIANKEPPIRNFCSFERFTNTNDHSNLYG